MRRTTIAAAACSSSCLRRGRCAVGCSFYAGKSINVLIGFTPGGGYDIYGRTLARHMGRYIPGNPQACAAKHAGRRQSCAPPTISTASRPRMAPTIALFAPGVMFEPLLGRPSAEAGQFEATKFTWLGSVSKEVARLRLHGLDRHQDLGRHAERRNPSSRPPAAAPRATCSRPCCNNMFNLPLKLVTGYPGGTEMILAMERHEADGRCGWSWTSLLSRSQRAAR